MKSYISFEAVYDAILKDGYDAVRGGAIVTTLNFEELLTNDWEKLLFKRLTDYKIIDGYYSDKLSVFHEVKIISELDRAAGVAKMLAFDTDYLRKERRRNAKYGDQLPELYFSDGDVTVKYSLVKNNAKKLAVVFQPKWAKVEYIYPNIGQITDDNFDATMQFNALQFTKLPKHYPQYDFLFIQDAWNVAGGWYMTNFGNVIYDNVVSFVSKYAQKYEETVALGSSKGGYGAYHVGKKVPEIQRIGLAGPILSAVQYAKVDSSVIRNLSNNHKNDELLTIIEANERQTGKIEKLVVSTNESDYQPDLIKALLEIYPETKLFENDQWVDHDDVIRNSYRDVFSEVLV